MALGLISVACSSSGGSGAQPSGSGGLGGAGGVGAVGGTGGLGAGGVGATGSGGAGPGTGGTTGTGRAACDPGTGSPFQSLESKAQLLIDNADTIRGLTFDADYVYWAEDNTGIQRIPAAGGTKEVLIAEKAATFFDLEPSYLYFGLSPTGTDASATVSRVPRGQWSQTPELSGAPILLGAWAIDGATFYGFDQTNNEIWKQDFVTGKKDVLVPNRQAGAIALGGGYLYFVDTTGIDAAISRVSTAGGTPEQLAQSAYFQSGGLAVIGQSVYWGDANGVEVLQTGAPSSAKLLGLAGPGLFGVANSYQFTSVGDRVYWVDDGGNVGWTKTDGSACGTVLSDGFPPTVAFGPGYLYYDVFGFPDQIWRLPL